jgi:hypothetical protein
MMDRWPSHSSRHSCSSASTSAVRRCSCSFSSRKLSMASTELSNSCCKHQTNQQTRSENAESATDARLAPARDPGHERRWLDLIKASQYTKHIAGVCHRPSSSAIYHVLAASQENLRERHAAPQQHQRRRVPDTQSNGSSMTTQRYIGDAGDVANTHLNRRAEV